MTPETYEFNFEKIRQERIKLFASYLNIAAAGSFVAASVTQPFFWITSHPPDAVTTASFGIISFGFSVLLHLGAQAVLGRL